MKLRRARGCKLFSTRSIIHSDLAVVLAAAPATTFALARLCERAARRRAGLVVEPKERRGRRRLRRVFVGVGAPAVLVRQGSALCRRRQSCSCVHERYYGAAGAVERAGPKSQRDAVFYSDGVERFRGRGAVRGVGVAEQDLLRRRARICEMMPVARTLQEPVEFPRGVLFALLIEHNADDDSDEYADAIVLNNHYDTDGVLSCFALLEPEFALKHKQVFIEAAESGDFGEFSSENGVKLDIALSSICDPLS